MKRLTPDMDDSESVHIAIVGCGPKGLYGFERLAASFNLHSPSVPVTIDIFNRSAYFGAGDVYHPEQVPYLLINNPVGDINMWIDEHPSPVVSNPQSCVDWLQEQGENISETDYISRAKVGRYLNDGFQSIADNLPQNVYLNTYIAEVSDIRKSNDRYELTYKLKNSGNPNSEIYDSILLATGHPKPQCSPRENLFLKKTNEFETGGFIPFIYPVTQNLAGISAGSSVGIKGLGLTFIDAVLALTEGRNGQFKATKNDQLEYIPSGDEPSKIYPFSRTGLPMIPRNSTYHDVPLKFFTEKNIQSVLEKSSCSKIDFINHLLPILKKEMIYTFYKTQTKQTKYQSDLTSCSSFEEVEYFINRFHNEFPDSDVFDFDSYLNPMENSEYDTSDSLNKLIQNYQHFSFTEASKGDQTSGWAAVSSLWKRITPVFNEFYSFGGLTAESHHKFDRWYRTNLNRISFGPPLKTAAKLIALQECGLLDYSVAVDPEISINEEGESFTLTCNKTKTHRSVEYLVDARIPKVSVTDHSSLFRNMFNRGLISMFENKSEKSSYLPGCPTISPEGNVINSEGKIEHGIVLTGTPTEGITFDNDTLSRYRNNFMSSWAESISKSCINQSESHEIT